MKANYALPTLCSVGLLIYRVPPKPEPENCTTNNIFICGIPVVILTRTQLMSDSYFLRQLLYCHILDVNFTAALIATTTQ